MECPNCFSEDVIPIADSFTMALCMDCGLVISLTGASPDIDEVDPEDMS